MGDKMKKILMILTCLLLFTGCSKGYKGYVVNKEYSEKGVKSYNNIKYDEYKKKIDNKDTFLLFVWQEGCSHCEAFKPTFDKVIKNMGLKVYGIDLKSLSEEQYAVFKNKTFVTGTPSLVLIEKGTYIEKFVGDKTEEELLNFLEEYKVIKEA